MSARLGEINTLPIIEITDEGTWLDAGNRMILLPRRYAPRDSEVGESLEISLYRNEDGQVEATRKLPHTPLGSIAFLKVKSVSNGTAFVDIGLPRDLVIPPEEQVKKLEPLDRAVVLVCFDEAHGKLYGTTVLHRHLSNRNMEYAIGDEVELLIYERTDFGWRAVVDGQFHGVLHEKEIFHDVKRGRQFKGYIRDIEKGGLLVSLQRDGLEGLEDAAERIMTFLVSHKGYMRLTDESDPEEIKLRLRMSKKTFKKAIGHLMRQNKVKMSRRGVKLVRDTASPTTETDA